MRSILPCLLMVLVAGCSSSDGPSKDASLPQDVGQDAAAKDVFPEPDTAKPAGTEGGPCYGNGTCNEGLTCASELCVRLPDASIPQDSEPASPDAGADGPTADGPQPDQGAPDLAGFDAYLDGPTTSNDGPAQPCSSHAECDDGLNCTTDICGVGGCVNVINGSFCVIDGVCLVDGEGEAIHPCKICAPTQSATEWSDAPGDVACDDGDPCSHTDKCMAGQCQGTSYSCDDGLDCTTDTCTGAGPNGCMNIIKADHCLIEGACRTKDEAHPSLGCLACSPSSESTAWSLKPAHCLVPDGSASQKCYAQGQANPTAGCQVCTPATSTTTLTTTAGYCVIKGFCYVAGGHPTSSCLECSPAVSNSNWTADPTPCPCTSKDDCKDHPHGKGCVAQGKYCGCESDDDCDWSGGEKCGLDEDLNIQRCFPGP